MPFIPDDQKDPGIEHFEPENVGQLTWAVYRICRDHFLRDESFKRIADVRAALASATHELNRRYFDEYEDEKREQNGDA